MIRPRKPNAERTKRRGWFFFVPKSEPPDLIMSMKLSIRVTIFLKNTCSIIGIVVPDRLMGICIAEKRKAEVHISTAPFVLSDIPFRVVIIFS